MRVAWPGQKKESLRGTAAFHGGFAGCLQSHGNSDACHLHGLGQLGGVLDCPFCHGAVPSAHAGGGRETMEADSEEFRGF